jgi:glycerol-3-phosphate acyltransferase PlsY
MSLPLTASLFIVVAYLIGSLSFAVIVSRAMGLDDPRGYGSGNPGATNVLRSGRKSAALLTLLGDAFKGWVAVALARALAPQFGLADSIAIGCGLAAFLGHLYPAFFRFKGGKGVATALGVLLGFAPALGYACIATWLAMALVFRLSSLAALTAATCAPLFAWLLLRDAQTAAVVLGMSVLLFYRHASNIQKLLAGKESRIGKPG